MYQDKKKTLASQGFLRAFQPSFSLRSKFTPKNGDKTFFIFPRDDFLPPRDDFSSLGSRLKSLGRVRKRSVFTPFWHSAPKGGRSSPPRF